MLHDCHIEASKWYPRFEGLSELHNLVEIDLPINDLMVVLKQNSFHSFHSFLPVIYSLTSQKKLKFNFSGCQVFSIFYDETNHILEESVVDQIFASAG